MQNDISIDQHKRWRKELKKSLDASTFYYRLTITCLVACIGTVAFGMVWPTITFVFTGLFFMVLQMKHSGRAQEIDLVRTRAINNFLMNKLDG